MNTKPKIPSERIDEICKEYADKEMRNNHSGKELEEENKNISLCLERIHLERDYKQQAIIQYLDENYKLNKGIKK